MWTILLVIVAIAAAFFAVTRLLSSRTLPTSGSSAPDFSLRSQDGSQVSLKDYRGKWVALYFYPKDMTPGCTLEAHNFQHDQEEFARRNAFLALRVFVDDRIHARLVHAARLAERDVLTRDVLQFDRDVFEHVPQPGALAFAHAPDESAWLAVRAAVLFETGQGGHEAVDETGTEAPGRPLFEFAQVQFEPDDREMRVQRRADENRAVEYAHAGTSLLSDGALNACVWKRPANRRLPVASAG